MTSPPEIKHVYLIATEGQWDVTAIADDHATTPDRIEREIQYRATSGGRGRVHVWRARITDLVEAELVPACILVPGEPERAR